MSPNNTKTTKVQFIDDPKTPPLLQSESISHPPSIAGTDDEDYDDYDWSDEEDLVDEEAKFEQKMGKTDKLERHWFRRFIATLFSSLIGSTLLAGILITPGILVHFYWFKPHPSAHRAYVRDNIQAWLFWTAANLVISWYIAMLINLVPIILRYFISLSWGHVSESVKSKIEMYNSVKDTAKPAFYAASAYASWIIIFDHIYILHSDNTSINSRAPYTDPIAEVALFFFFLVLVGCAKGMISHFIAFSFYHTAYKERINTVKETLDVVEMLRNYRPKQHKTTRTPMFNGMGFSALSSQNFNPFNGAFRNAHQPSASREDSGSDGDNNIKETDRFTQQMDSKNSKGSIFSRFGCPPGLQSVKESDSSMEKTQDRIRRIDDDIELCPIPSTMDASYSQELLNSQGGGYSTITPIGSPRTSLDGHTETVLKQATRVLKNTAALHDARNISGRLAEWDINSAHEAKRLARSIYQRLKDRGRVWLIPADFYPAFPSRSLAEEAFKVFDKDNTGDITRAEIKTILLKVYKERRILSRSMRDVGEALRTLDNILLFFAGVMLFFIGLSVFGVNVDESLTSIYSLFIAASFFFKNSASSAFDSIMFLFVTHPYDTGDRVFIDLDNLVVKKVGLFATVFIRCDGTETYYFNNQLSSKFIMNARRSGKTSENLTMQVAWTTPLNMLDALEKNLNNWLSTEPNRWFEPSTSITLQHIAFQRYMELTIVIGHNGTWQDWNLRCTRKTAFHAAVQYYCRELGIIAYEAPLPVVYANPDTNTYNPTTNPDKGDLFPSSPYLTSPSSPYPLSPSSPYPLSPSSPNPTSSRTKQHGMAQVGKPVLGFLPPPADVSSHLMRARKIKKRKAAVGAGNVGTG